jgi:hypothetical protein
MFYTGYAMNFDDILNAVGDRHYFISRWSAYYPGYVADLVLGPVAGRLALRLLLVAAGLLCIWRIRPGWSWHQRILIGTVVITTPMFVRALFTDYVEYAVVAFGVCLIAVCVRPPQSAWSGAVAGSLAALMVVANPYAITVVAAPLAVCVLLGASTVRSRVVICLSVLVAGVATLAGGYVLFRWRYGIGDVYRPTIEFARSFEGSDPLQSPRLDWLWRFSWLFIVPVLFATALGVRVLRLLRFDRVDIIAICLCGWQYLYQWFDQFVRGGNGLEISYYWSFSLPSFLVALALVLGRITERMAPARILVALFLWLAFLVVGVPDSLRLPVGGGLFVLLIVFVSLMLIVFRFSPSFVGAVLILLLGWMQIGAPNYDPSAYHPYNVDPHYDELFRAEGNGSEEVYAEARWFAAQMDKVPNDASASFLVPGPWANSVVALYAPHVAGRLLSLDSEGGLTPEISDELRNGSRPLVAVFGTDDGVAAVVDQIRDELGVGSVIYEANHDRHLGYRLVVYRMPDSRMLPFTWQAQHLPAMTGAVTAGEVTVGAGDTPGTVTFGPYSELPVGHYIASVQYRSAADSTTVVGGFDVASTRSGVVSRTDLRGTGGVRRSVSLSFEVDEGAAAWEFRTQWAGVSEVAFQSVTVDRALP